MKKVYTVLLSAMQAVSGNHDDFFYDVYEALRCPDPSEINRIYERRR